MSMYKLCQIRCNLEIHNVFLHLLYYWSQKVLPTFWTSKSRPNYLFAIYSLQGSRSMSGIDNKSEQRFILLTLLSILGRTENIIINVLCVLVREYSSNQSASKIIYKEGNCSNQSRFCQ